MTLIGESGEVSDLGQGVVGIIHKYNRFLNPQLPNVIAKRQVIEILGELA